MSGTTAAATAPVAPAESPRAEDSPSSASASDQDSEGEVPSESETTRSSGAVKGRNPSAPRELGDLADDGFSGTRPGFQVLKVGTSAVFESEDFSGPVVHSEVERVVTSPQTGLA